jgi:hypothetical protein
VKPGWPIISNNRHFNRDVETEDKPERSMRASTILVTALLLISVAVPATADKRDGPYHQAFKEISLLNLVNGLYLSQEQKVQLVSIARQAKPIMTRMETESESTLNAAMSDMETIKSSLTRGETPPQEAVKRAKKANLESKAVLKENMQQLFALERKAAAVLTGNQRAVVRDFKACLVPPKSSTNPAAAGAAKDTGPSEKVLAKLYRVDGPMFERGFEMYFSHHIDRLEDYKGPMTQTQIDVERRRIRAIVQKAKAMDQTDFALAKTDLALQMVASVDRVEEKREELREEFTRPWGFGKIGRWLLDPAIIPILENQ